MTRPGIEPSSLGPFANTLPHRTTRVSYDKSKEIEKLIQTQFLLNSDCVNSTLWMLNMDKTNRKKKLNRNFTRMLRAILNKSWKQHLTKQLLYGHSPPISKTIQIRRTRHAEHCWKSKNELISDVLLWTPSHGRASVG